MKRQPYLAVHVSAFAATLYRKYRNSHFYIVGSSFFCACPVMKFVQSERLSTSCHREVLTSSPINHDALPPPNAHSSPHCILKNRIPQTRPPPPKTVSRKLPTHKPLTKNQQTNPPLEPSPPIPQHAQPPLPPCSQVPSTYCRKSPRILLWRVCKCAMGRGIRMIPVIE